MQVGDHVDASSGIDGVAAEGMSQLMRPDRGVEPGAPRRGGHQLRDGVRTHRRADGAAEQIDEHEVAVGGPGHAHALELVDVERLHHKEIQRHHPLAARLGPGPVRVVFAAHHMQMRPLDLAAQSPRIHQQVHVAAPQPAHLPTPQSRAGHQQHDQPVPRGPARPQQRDDLGRRRPDRPSFPVPAADAGPASATPSGRPRRGPRPADPDHRRPHTASPPTPPHRDRSRPRAPPCPARRSAHR